MRNLEIFLLWPLKVQKENMNYRWRLEISASKFLQKIQICDKHFKIVFTIIFSVSKIEISRKKALEILEPKVTKCEDPLYIYWTLKLRFCENATNILRNHHLKFVLPWRFSKILKPFQNIWTLLNWKIPM